MLTLGYACGPATAIVQRRMNELASLLGRLTHVDIDVRSFFSYDELTQASFRRELDLAWLPPIPFAALLSERAALPLASVRRVPFQSAIIVATDSSLQRPHDLIGTRAAWVDKHSAAGFVLPRIKLSRLGVDPRSAFDTETFYGSHDAVVAAVASRAVDFGATWAHPERGTVRGPWTKSVNDVRVLSTFGSIPPDVIAARPDLDRATRKAIVGALKSIYSDRQSRWLVSHVLGTEAFYRPNLDLYGPLQESVAGAYRAGLLDIGEPPTGEFDVQHMFETNPRIPIRATIPDPMEASTKSNPRWTLAEIEIDEEDIEITFD